MGRAEIDKKISRMIRNNREAGTLYADVIKNTEKLLIEGALKRGFGNQSIAAKLLGINRNTLRTKIKKLDIDINSFKI